MNDVLFLRREGLSWRRASPILRSPKRHVPGALVGIARTPSEYLAGVARGHVQGLDVSVVPNGSPEREPSSPRAPRGEFAERAGAHVVAVVGAIGPHKGARVLEELARNLAGSAITLVVVGYMDTQILHGWHGDNLYVHGAFNDEELAPLLAGYGAELVLFPNIVPESFSFTLSDVWAAGLPAVVPPWRSPLGRARAPTRRGMVAAGRLRRRGSGERAAPPPLAARSR